MSDTDRQTLRKQIRALRRAVPARENEASSRQVCRQIAESAIFHQSSKIAVFLAADGEIDLASLLGCDAARDKQFFMPVSLTDGSWTLQFHRYTPGDALRRTSLGVLEPENQSSPIAPDALDLVLTPLVAFDERCFRMGMGKGYYDRTFAFKKRQREKKSKEMTPSSPILLGVAHECQRMDSLMTDWWDVPLDAVITPERIYGDSTLF